MVVLVAALIPTFLLNALRQAFTTGYEKWKDESLINDEPKGKGVDLTNMITDGSNASTLATNDFEDQNKNGHTSQLNQPKPFAAAQSDTRKFPYAAVTKKVSTIINSRGNSMPQTERLMLKITGFNEKTQMHSAEIIDSLDTQWNSDFNSLEGKISIHTSYIDNDAKVKKIGSERVAKIPVYDHVSKKTKTKYFRTEPDRPYLTVEEDPFIKFSKDGTTKTK